MAIVRPFNRAGFECQDVFEVLKLDPLMPECCTDCPRSDPSRVVRGIDYTSDRVITVNKFLPNGDRDYNFGAYIITCCFHWRMMEKLSQEQWESLARFANVSPFAVYQLPREIKTKLVRAVMDKEKGSLCEFCSRRYITTKCGYCFPRG